MFSVIAHYVVPCVFGFPSSALRNPANRLDRRCRERSPASSSLRSQPSCRAPQSLTGARWTAIHQKALRGKGEGRAVRVARSLSARTAHQSRCCAEASRRPENAGVSLPGSSWKTKARLRRPPSILEMRVSRNKMPPKPIPNRADVRRWRRTPQARQEVKNLHHRYSTLKSRTLSELFASNTHV